MKPLLETRNLQAGYSGINVLWDVSIAAEAGKTTVIVGPNGAGKTTLLRAIMGLNQVEKGEILLEGKPCHNRKTWDLVNEGVVMIPEGRLVFPEMSVQDNLMMGAYPRASRANWRRNLEMVFEMFPRMKERRHQLAGSLSGGEAQMLAIGRGLMEQPKVCLIDEPSLGLAPVVVNDIFKTLARLREEGLTIVLVEQNTAKALEVADYVYLMQSGRVLLSESADKVDLQALHDLYFARPTD